MGGRSPLPLSPAPDWPQRGEWHAGRWACTPGNGFTHTQVPSGASPQVVCGSPPLLPVCPPALVAKEGVTPAPGLHPQSGSDLGTQKARQFSAVRGTGQTPCPGSACPVKLPRWAVVPPQSCAPRGATSPAPQPVLMSAPCSSWVPSLTPLPLLGGVVRTKPSPPEKSQL